MPEISRKKELKKYCIPKQKNNIQVGMEE